MRNSLARLLLAVASILLALVLAEGAFRVVRYLVTGPNGRATVADAELGWVHNTGRPVITRQNACGEAVVTQPAPSPYIIRAPRDTTGTRVLFLGDSTTHAHEVSTGSAYYDTVEAEGRGKYSVWAAGVGSYGNLQEYLLLRKVYDEIHPSIVVWQLDGNDVANNVHRLDSATLNNNPQLRPYLDPSSGAIEMRSTASRIFRVSQGAAFLLARVLVLDSRFRLGIVDRIESWMQPPAEEMPALTRQGLQVLDHMLTEAVGRYPETRFAGFCANADNDDLYGEIFRRHGARYWSSVSVRVIAEGTRTGTARTDCSPLDMHWNLAGNRIAGEILAAHLSEM